MIYLVIYAALLIALLAFNHGARKANAPANPKMMGSIIAMMKRVATSAVAILILISSYSVLTEALTVEPAKKESVKNADI